ncbi:MAG TPA: TetR/AcrR family transcriptional regulator [Gammaproteobacteria bacterium]|nr:TetR/AcrR family transcriptional regulator [Gammaproteobacteria bacterium]
MVATTAARIQAAARKLLDKEGAQAVTMRAVAKAVGITPMAIYRHYPDREALLNALADTGFQELAESLTAKRFSGDLETRLAKMADLYLDHAMVNPKLFELMFLTKREGARQYPGDFRARKSPTATLMADVIAEGMRQGAFRQDDPWEITFEMGALSHGLIMLYLGGRMAVSPAQFRALYKRSFRRYFDGIRN